jgi:hypothetical protein
MAEAGAGRPFAVPQATEFGSAMAAWARTSWRGAKRLALRSPMPVRTRKKVIWKPSGRPS